LKDYSLTTLILITGFLGAGKTTLLRSLLPLLKENGLRVRVILNDYANADLSSNVWMIPCRFVSLLCSL